MELADVLLVIDLQNGVLIDAGQEIYQRKTLLKRVNERITIFRVAKHPIVFIQHCDATLIKNTKTWKLVQELDSQASDIFIDKTHEDGFYKTNLQEALSKFKTKSLEVCGAQTEYCVDSTIKAAFDRGYRLQLGIEMTSTYDNSFMTAKQTIKFYEGIWKNRFVKFIDEK